MRDREVRDLRHTSSSTSVSRTMRAYAMRLLREHGYELDACPLTGKPIPWEIGDIVCPKCLGSGDEKQDEDADCCTRCDGFSVVDVLHPGEVDPPEWAYGQVFG